MGRAPCCAKVGLNRGRWSAEEDEILTKYIQTHGEGSWRSLPKKAGLLRCGKSCRLRWVNYLRADLKRGNILQEEEELIVKLHSEMGNRWSLIASKMPGRTDNEIKNYWNTHLSRKLAYSGIDPATHKELSASTSSATAEFLRSRRKRSNKRSATSTKERKTRVTNQQVAATKPSEPAAAAAPPPPLPPSPEKTNPDAPVNSNSDSESSKLDDDSLSSLLEELYDPSSSSNQELLTFLDNDLVDCASNDEWLPLPAGMEDSPSYGNGLSRSSSSSSCNNVITEEPEPPAAAAAVPAIWEEARSPPLPMEIDVLGISATEQCKSMSISETFDFLMDSDEECDMGMTSCSKATDEVWSFCYFNYHHDDANGQQQQQQHQL